MPRSRIIIISLAAILVVGAAYFTLVSDTASAQRDSTSRVEYAVITGSYVPYPADGPSSVAGAVNICYLQSEGCRPEEVRYELNISKFLQDERLENTARVKRLAQERALQTAFARAIAKMGSEGWEMVTSPPIEFDLYYTNQQGIASVKEGVRSERQHVWFKRTRG